MTRELEIHGGKSLNGSVEISGFKHALVPIFAASLLGDEPVRLSNVPNIADRRVLSQILTRIGGAASYDSGILTLDPGGIEVFRVPDELAASVHGSLYLVPVMLARMGRVEIGLTGGCQIGSAAEGRRPTSHVVSVLERFGASFEVIGDRISGHCNRLAPCDIDIRDYATENLDGPSGPLVSGATKTAILAAATARGTSVIRNPYSKNDVVELIEFLQLAGVQLQWLGDRIEIEGRDRLLGAEHELSSDLIEFVTFLAASVYIGGSVEIELVNPDRVLDGLAAEIRLLESMGVTISRRGTRISAAAEGAISPQSVIVSSQSIFSDSHPFFTLLLSMAQGASQIEDRVWPGRLGYVEMCARLGMKVAASKGIVSISPGRAHLAGKSVVASELRGAAMLTIAALGIAGTTVIEGAHHLDRGYADFVGSLRGLGADLSLK